MGSEMCIRDRPSTDSRHLRPASAHLATRSTAPLNLARFRRATDESQHHQQRSEPVFVPVRTRVQRRAGHPWWGGQRDGRTPPQRRLGNSGAGLRPGPRSRGPTSLPRRLLAGHVSQPSRKWNGAVHRLHARPFTGWTTAGLEPSGIWRHLLVTAPRVRAQIDPASNHGPAASAPAASKSTTLS